MSSDFHTASKVEELSPGELAAHIPDHWQQGRGAFGGLVLGTLLRAIERCEPDAARVTRTLAGDLCGPVLPGPAVIRVRTLRRGNNQSNLAAELVQEGAVLATASAVLSPARAVEGVPRFGAPGATAASSSSAAELPAWRELPELRVAPPAGPAFAQHYEYRAAGTPFQKGTEPVIEGFIRERVALERMDAPALVGRLDAWWPTLFAIGAPRPVATVSFVAEMLVDPGTLDPKEPLRYRARMAAMHDGFFVELRELWAGERVVALNQQTFAILR